MKLLAPLTALALLTVTAAARADDSKPTADTSVAGSGSGSADTGFDAVQLHYPPPIVRVKLIAIGLVIAGGAWGAAFGAGTGYQTVPGANQLKIPVVGPWIALGKSGCASDETNCPGAGAKIGVRGGLYVLDGIAQLAGLGLIVEAIAMKTEAAAAPDKKAAFLGLRFGGVELRPVPLTSPSLTGIGLVGTF